MEFTGRVVKKLFGKGSKSEHDAVMIETRNGNYVLRRQGGNPFSDPELDLLIGKRIRGNGVLAGSTLIMSDWHVANEKDD
ncbi:MAG: hypothetical protein WAU45_16725 [Blastocatellia bacterium]